MRLVVFGAVVLVACSSFDEPATNPDGGAPHDATDGPAAETASDRYAAAVLEDAPIAFWRLTEKSGAVTMASAVGTQVLVPTNGPALGVPGLFGGTGGAVGFDGGQGRRLVASATPNLMEKNGGFAIELWLYLGDRRDDGYRHLVSQSDGTREISVFVRGETLGFDLYGDGSLATVDRPVPAPLAWHHVVVQAVTLAEPRLWVDGAEVTNGGSRAATAIAAHALTFGSETDGAQSLPDGSKLAEIAVYDHPLTAERVLVHLERGNAN